jgi:hypothetical protein
MRFDINKLFEKHYSRIVTYAVEIFVVHRSSRASFSYILNENRLGFIAA